MHHGFTNQTKIIAINVLAQQYTAKLMLENCNVRNLAFILLRPKSFLFVCFLLNVIDHIKK
jgi:hypothetical protein